MRILYIIPNLKKGGAERLLLSIASEINKRPEFDMCIVSLSNENHFPEFSEFLNIKTINAKVIPSILGKTITDIDSLNSLIKIFKPDVIHSHLFEAEIVSHWFLFSGIKYISHCHDNMKQLQNLSLKTFTSKQLLTYYYEKYILVKKYIKSQNSFIAISKHTESYYLKSLPQSLSKRIHLLPNAINFDKFNSKAKKNNHHTDTIKLINVGLIIPKKNQQLLISIVANIKARGYNVRLTLLGFGYEYDKIKQLVISLGLDKEVNMPGNVNNVEEYLSENDIYVHSAYYEPFGLVLIEAMAAGLPVVCLDGGGNRDIIENGKNGFMIEQQNAELFADKIIELHQNKALYKQISDYAQEFAKRYDIKDYVDKLIEIYKSAPKCIV